MSAVLRNRFSKQLWFEAEKRRAKKIAHSAIHEVVVNKLFSVHTWQFMRPFNSPNKISSVTCKCSVELGVGKWL